MRQPPVQAAEGERTGASARAGHHRLEQRYRRALSSRRTGETIGADAAGKKRGARRTAIVAGLLLALAATGWFAFGQGPRAVEQVLGYVVTDATQTVVTFQVSKEPSATSQCQVQALDSSYGIVGWRIVDIPPAQTRTTTYTVTLRTDSLAVTGTVDGCWVRP